MQLKNPLNKELFYETRGAGEPLILIPGFASGAWSWLCQLEDLSKSFQLITYDPRGIGKSGTDDFGKLANLSMNTFVSDVLQILDELKIEKAHVLGASFGGFVALETVLRFPERINKLILSCTSAGGANHVKPDLEILRGFTPDPNLTVGEHIRKFIRLTFTDEFNIENAEKVEAVCRLRESNEVAEQTYFAQLQAAFTFDKDNRLGEIKNKTLVITGDHDNVVPMENSLNLAKNILNAELKIIENGSHLIFIENSNEFNYIISEWLNQH